MSQTMVAKDPLNYQQAKDKETWEKTTKEECNASMKIKLGSWYLSKRGFLTKRRIDYEKNSVLVAKMNTIRMIFSLAKSLK